MSALVIGVVATGVVYGTRAFLSDRESVKGTYSAGTIDISVDGQNPWTTDWENELDKPSETSYMTFNIRNDGENPANIWKRITDIETDGGDAIYCGVSSEPEFEAEGGVIKDDGTCDTGNWVARDNLASYMVYDLYVCMHPGEVGCDLNEDGGPDLDDGNWQELLPEDQQVRVDNVGGVWIKLGDQALEAGRVMTVAQSYHLMAWDDASEDIIGNWAQGDVMKFDDELEARQVSAPAPKGAESSGTLGLTAKDPVTWEALDGAKGTLIYDVKADEFDYELTANGLESSISYSLIYYADPWPGDNPGALIGSFTTDSSGELDEAGSKDLGMDLPDSADDNYPVGAKIQLVLSDDYDDMNMRMTGWRPEEYLFEENLIKYNDTDV